MDVADRLFSGRGTVAGAIVEWLLEWMLKRLLKQLWNGC